MGYGVPLFGRLSRVRTTREEEDDRSVAVVSVGVSTGSGCFDLITLLNKALKNPGVASGGCCGGVVGSLAGGVDILGGDGWINRLIPLASAALNQVKPLQGKGIGTNSTLAMVCSAELYATRTLLSEPHTLYRVLSRREWVALASPREIVSKKSKVVTTQTKSGHGTPRHAGALNK